MEQRKRIYIFLTFFICTICLALLTLSLATHRWIVANPIRKLIFLKNSTTLTSTNNSVIEDINIDNDNEISNKSKFRGQIYFGLFQGTKILNYGLGDRTTIIWLKQEMLRNPNLMSFTLWLLTILSISIAMIFGLVAAIFSIINTVMTPIEQITGVHGLYLWNILAGSFCTIATLLWLIQYYTKLINNIMTDDEINDGWTSSNRTKLGFSYYVLILVIILHLINIFIIYYGTNIIVKKHHHHHQHQHHHHRHNKNRSTKNLQQKNSNTNNRQLPNNNNHHHHNHHHHHHNHDKHPEGLIMLY